MSAAQALAVHGLTIAFASAGRPLVAVRDLSFDVAAGETLAIVGESGSGKSVSALALLGLLPPAAQIVSGSITLGGREMRGLGEGDWNRARGRRIAMVFQNSAAALNPVLTIGEQITEAIRRHQPLDRAGATAAAARLLERVHLPRPGDLLGAYPHELSGGMRQRVLIAMAIANRPSVLIADEPTTGLDADVRAGIMALLRDLQQQMGMALVLITHDLGLVTEVADRVLILYAGRSLEQVQAARIGGEGAHPYTRALLAARPRPRPVSGPRPRLADIPGQVPPLVALPQQGCVFAPRCAEAFERCRFEAPAPAFSASGAMVACHLSSRSHLAERA